MSMFCNVMMLLLLYVHVCVTRTGWKTRPRPKTVIFSINKSNQINLSSHLFSLSVCLSVCLSVSLSLSLSVSVSLSHPPSNPSSIKNEWVTLRQTTPGFNSSITPHEAAVYLFVGCLTSQQHASVSQGRICSDHFTCCHTAIEVVDSTFHLTQSQYTDAGLTSPSADPISQGA